MSGNGKHITARPTWGEVRPAYANVFIVGTAPELTFGEGFGTEEGHVYHSAIILGRIDAKSLAEGILNALAKGQP